MSFTKHSNFNPKANFSEVKFGENMPVLEVELNEMQQIQNEARADVVRDSIPSGFVTLGEIDYNYCKSNDNQIKLKTESVAYVNGYRITIPQDTIIEIGESDKVREDLVFLEVWKDYVTDTDTVKEYGGENNSEIDNHIKDERYPIATSRRVALKYRIRHIADVDFKTYELDGFTSNTPNVSNFTYNNEKVTIHAGYPEPLPPKTYYRYVSHIQRKNYNPSGTQEHSSIAGICINDVGLYVGGSGKTFQLNTFDGYVYAIPMFRLKRKPNVGLASPFEYKKIHNQLDPKKFAHLVGQENVEKVHSVNVKGRTLRNLHHTKYGRGKYTLSASNNDWYSNYVSEDGRVAFDITRTGDSGWKYIHLGSLNFQLLKPNTKYLVIFEDVIVPSYISISFKTHMDTDLVSSYGNLYSGSDRVIITTNSEMIEANQILYAYVSTEKMGHFELKNVAIYEYVNGMENWDKSMFSFEPGIKSLGEESNNSITIENNLVKEGVYVPELQNNILPTYPEVTHITWGEDVVIPPELEIELKRGEELLQTITQLPVKLETTGDEKLHVKSMKGRTLVNVLKDSGKDLIISPNTNTPLKTQYLLNTSKKYFVKIFLHSADNVVNESDRCFKIQWFNASDYNGYRNVSYQELKNGVGFIIPPYEGDIEDAFKNNPHIAIWHTNQGVQGNVKLSFMCLEYQDGIEDLDLKYFEGMQSVKMPVLTTTGKNLFDGEFELDKYLKEDGTLGASTNWATTKNYISVRPNTTYTQNIRMHSYIAYVFFYDKNKNIVGAEVGSDVSSYNSASYTTPNNCYYIKTCYDYSSVGNHLFQVEEGSTATKYEPYKTNILSTPSDLELREIGDVKDTLDCLTGEVTERIREVVLNGGEDWTTQPDSNWNNDTHISFSFIIDNMKINMWNSGKINCISDTFKTILLNNDSYAVPEEFIGSNGSQFDPMTFNIKILRSRLNGNETVSGFKQWLSQNPITVQYELATESIKTVDLTEDDYVGKSKVTYQLAEPLNYIPNGAYDEIKGDKLIKRTNKIYLDGTEAWGKFTDETTTTYRTSFNIADGKPSSVCVCSHFEYETGATVERVKIYMTVNANLSITVLKSDFPTVDSFKTWLSNNRPMVIYELANPVEIPLKEVSPLECDFSLNRQFKRGYENCLKELPNGVKDVIENGKVKRRTQRVTLTGNEKHEDWSVHTYVGNITNTIAFRCSLNFTCDDRNKLNIVCDKFKAVPVIYFDHNDTPCIASGQQTVYSVLLRVPRSSLSSEDVAGLRLYLKNNPINLICELETSVTEELTEENCRYVPYMPLNSYVGSLYVADEINQTKFLTAFSPSEYEVQTYHRYFSNEFNVFEDIKRKKSPYGHETYLEEVDGKYVEKFTAGLEKHEIEDLRHKVSLTGFDYNHLLQDSFLKLIKGELS